MEKMKKMKSESIRKRLRHHFIYHTHMFYMRMLRYPLFFRVCNKLFSDKQFIKIVYLLKTEEKLDLANPVGFNQKLQWLKLNWYDPLATTCADKLAVRDYVSRTIGSKYLNDLYSVYDSAKVINYERLPDAFVIKTTSGSGSVILCDDKKSVNKMEIEKKLDRWLKLNYYWVGREWVYKEIPPKIVIEKYLSTGSKKIPDDYKIFCFFGEPVLIEKIVDRYGNKKKLFFDLSWKEITDPDKLSDRSIPCNPPRKLAEMLDISRKLSKPFPHVRVDLYEVDDQLIFGELTFFHNSGFKKFSNHAIDLLLDKHLDLSKINSDRKDRSSWSS